MKNGFQELPGLHVEVNEVVFMPDLDAPPEKPFPFVYFLSIVNRSQQVVVIKGRKWILCESSGETTVVEGQGVVGENPVIQSGEQFSYNSYHVVGEDSEVSGAFFGFDEKGQGVVVKIPSFHLKIPDEQ